MDLGSIADVLEGEAGGLIKNILGMALFTPFIAGLLKKRIRTLPKL